MVYVIKHVAKSAATGKWQAYAGDRENGREAIFYGTSEHAVMREAIRWLGPENVLSVAIDDLSEILETLRGK